MNLCRARAGARAGAESGEGVVVSVPQAGGARAPLRPSQGNQGCSRAGARAGSGRLY